MNILLFFPFFVLLYFFFYELFLRNKTQKLKVKKKKKEAKLQDAIFQATTNICLSPWLIISQLLARDELWERNVYILWRVFNTWWQGFLKYLHFCLFPASFFFLKLSPTFFICINDRREYMKSITSPVDRLIHLSVSKYKGKALMFVMCIAFILKQYEITVFVN